jgi:NADPH2:quinone reductase
MALRKNWWEDIDPPEMGKDEVRIGVEACGVNFPDTLIIEGKYQFRPDPPFSPGAEVAGKVLEVGEGVRHVRVGDPVLALTTFGGYAEQVVAAGNRVIAMPKGMAFEVGAGFPMVYGTSYHALKQRSRLQSGETLLALGAAGGVGLAAVELGKIMGARVIAAAGSDEKLKVCKEHGADELVNYREGELKEEVKRLTGGKGADVIYDPVGGDAFDQSLSCINWNGRILVIGFASGTIPKAAVNRILLKGCAVVGVFWGRFMGEEPQAGLENFIELFDMFEKGQLKPHVSGTFPLEQAPEALEELTHRRSVGKVVLKTR